MISVIKKTLYLLDARERRQLYFLFSAILVMSVLEILGIASILPFMAVVANPDMVTNNKYLSIAYKFFHFSSTNSFMIFLGFLVFGIMVFNNVFAAFVTWFMLRLTWDVEHSLSSRILANYLNRPYSFFLALNTSNLSKNILMEVSQFVSGFLIPALQVMVKTILVAAIVFLLFVADSVLATLIIIVLGGTSATIFAFVRKRLLKLGKASVEANKERFKIVSEALGGIKEIKLFGLEIYFANNYSIPSKIFGKSQTMAQIISQLPRYAMEIVAFGGIMLIVIYLLTVKNSIAQILPFITLYAFASYKLMPALQQVLQGVTKMKFYIPVLDLLYHDVKKEEGKKAAVVSERSERISLKSEIELKNLSFSYPNTDKQIIKNIDLTIKAGTAIGLVGPTGSGKTTLVDIILGLLFPTGGKIFVDGVEIKSFNLRAWQANLGYVSQSIYLSDDTIARNIAFGLPDNKIDIKAIERASKIANLHDFIMTLPKGYDTVVGERGVKLSGGQRQRIGIARALYNDSDVLIMDEATSALDGITESTVIQALKNTSGEKTIITIAHRLSTVRDCDVIYIVEDGSIRDRGTYNDLMKNNILFREMVKNY